MKSTEKTRPTASMAAAVRQAQTELIARRLTAIFGGPVPTGMSALSAALVRKSQSPEKKFEQIVAEARRTGRRPSVIAATLARRAAKA